MSMWTAVLGACACAYGLKLLGYFVPGRWISGDRTSRVTSALPVALLAALVGVQAFGTPTGHLVIDARAAAVAAAVVALLLRAPFIVVVAIAANVAAALRWAGLG